MASSHSGNNTKGYACQIPAGGKDMSFAGDITPEDAYQMLQSQFAVLVDVRTIPEWQFTGNPDVSATQGRLATISWKNYPDFSLNAKFSDQIVALADVSKDTPLLFMCRSGGRSTDAAIAMTAAGYRQCYNIEGGFEGEQDAAGQRGKSKGWKAKHLPWKQG